MHVSRRLDIEMLCLGHRFSLSLSLSRPLSLFFLHLFSSSGWELGTPGAAASLA